MAEIKETTFGPKQYLVLRKSISTDQISDKQMYDDAGKKLGGFVAEKAINISGPWSVLYFKWDEANKETDIGIGFPIDGDVEVNDSEFSIIDIPEINASLNILIGSYEGLKKAHGELMEYTKEKGFQKGNSEVMAVEEYEIGPMSENVKEEDYKTNIYYLHN